MTDRRKVIVTGGAGYIGRCTASALEKVGFHPILIDNFSTGRRAMVGELTCFDIDLVDKRATVEAFQKTGKVFGVIHFAAKALVGESVEKPEEYFRNNVLSTLNVVEAAVSCGARLVHSSSCAVYGVPKKVPIEESTPWAPVSPYGASKCMAEDVIAQYVVHKNLRAINLRYFNPAGSVEDAKYGEAHEPETHLIPNVVRAHLSGEPIKVFGDDYDTPDGTCVRDYIHIADLVDAHIAALDLFDKDNLRDTLALNLGLGKGTSVKQVIDEAVQTLGGPVPHEIAPRRTGDPPELVADTRLAKELLGWAPKRDLSEMIRDHHAWITGPGANILR